MLVFVNWILIYGCFVSAVKASAESVRFLDNEKNCISSLMSSKYLIDDQFNASSYSRNYKPSAARILNVFSPSNSEDDGGWCPKGNARNKSDEWIEVDFRRMAIIKQIYTMGRGSGSNQPFTREIMIKYKQSDDSKWLDYYSIQNKSILTINTDARTKLRSKLQTIIAKRIRIYPIDTRQTTTPVCLKFAFLGCFFEDEFMSYNAPEGDSITIDNVTVDLHDVIYNNKSPSTFYNGPGLLMDNIAWRGKFEFINHLKEEGKIFTGWSCKNRQKNPYIILEFFFEKERNFSLITLYSVIEKRHNIHFTGPITVTIIDKNDVHSSITVNSNDYYRNSTDLYETLIEIHLKHLKGYNCKINITCGTDNLILLSEVTIKSIAAKSIRTDVSDSLKQSTIQYFNTTDKYTTSLFPDDFDSKTSIWKQQDITALALVILIILLLLFVIGMGAMCYKFQRSKRNKLTKKLELVAQCNNQAMVTPGTVFTIQSKTPIITTSQQPKYFSDAKTSFSVAYSGSQPSDGVYASWPNTDEDPDLATIDKEEEKCLLSAEVGEISSMKEYATYQCGVNPTGANDYITNDNLMYRPQGNTRPSSIVTTLPNLSTLSVPLLKIVASYETPKTTPIVTYRSIKKPVHNNIESISYQHLLNYRGACGDVDFRYQPSFQRVDQSNLESNIRVIPISSLIPIKPLIRGEFGAISLCKILIETDSQTGNCVFVKNLNVDCKPVVKSGFIMDLKILSSINCTNVVKLEAIAIENEMSTIDLVSIIKSTRFYILMDYLNGYNLKDFLRNIYYSNVSQQDFKSTQSLPYSQISLSSMMIIITQIANGMKHLEEIGLTHRDLACRNCIIDLRMHVKIYPGGLVTTKPNEDYCSIELLNHLVTFPLRWMAPESIIGGIFTVKSDVWSFAVTLWEIFTLCSLVPYGSLTNEALLDLMSQRNNTPRLPCPQNCPKEIYELMNQCWNWDESLRPKFVDIHKFIQFKASNSTSQAQIILPAPPPDDHTT